jgi:hypothetical protein
MWAAACITGSGQTLKCCRTTTITTTASRQSAIPRSSRRLLSHLDHIHRIRMTLTAAHFGELEQYVLQERKKKRSLGFDKRTGFTKIQEIF